MWPRGMKATIHVQRTVCTCDLALMDPTFEFDHSSETHVVGTAYRVVHYTS